MRRLKTFITDLLAILTTLGLLWHFVLPSAFSTISKGKSLNYNAGNLIDSDVDPTSSCLALTGGGPPLGRTVAENWFFKSTPLQLVVSGANCGLVANIIRFRSDQTKMIGYTVNGWYPFAKTQVYAVNSCGGKSDDNRVGLVVPVNEYQECVLKQVGYLIAP